MYILSKAMNNNTIPPEKDFQDAFGSISEVLITYVTKKGKARPRVMLCMGAGHIKKYLNCSDMTYFAIICSTKTFQANLEVLEVLITYATNRGKARVMLHMGAGHSNNCQKILKLFGYDTFFNNLQHKNISSKFGGINHLCYQ